MKPKNFCVYLLLDVDGTPRFLGLGKRLRGVHPADKLWAERFRSDSSVSHWLRTMPEQPKRGRIIGGVADDLNEHTANELLTINRTALRQEGAKLLNNRDHATWKTGGGLRKPVVADGLYFPSVREAARFHGIDVHTLLDRIRSPKFEDWYYQK
jgi:hypothetical protein